MSCDSGDDGGKLRVFARAFTAALLIRPSYQQGMHRIRFTPHVPAA
jgi:hypothetical protein